MAKISPVSGLVIRAAPLVTWSLEISLSSAAKEASAACWRERSRVVVTRRPPRSTVCSPYFWVNKSLI